MERRGSGVPLTPRRRWRQRRICLVLLAVLLCVAAPLPLVLRTAQRRGGSTVSAHQLQRPGEDSFVHAIRHRLFRSHRGPPADLERPYEEFTAEDGDKWKAQMLENAVALRKHLSRRAHPRSGRLGHAPAPGSTAPKIATRGVIIPAGGAVLLANAFLVVSLLRVEHGCKLPIVVFHNGPVEVDNATVAYFKERFSNITFTDVTTLPYPRHHRHILVKHYAFKAYCVYQAPFDEVLLLDADSLPLAPVEPLFESRQWRDAGNLFWPDLTLNAGFYGIPVEAYGVFGLPAPQAGPDVQWLQSTEAGQFLFDRRRLADVLEWYWFLNSHGPQGVYTLMLGDKDTMQLAFALAGKADLFRQVRHYPRFGTCKNSDQTPVYAHLGQLHSDPAGRPAFLHQAGSIYKFEPLQEHVCHVSHATAPLSEERAVLLRHWDASGKWTPGLAPEHVREVTRAECEAATRAAGGKGGDSWAPGEGEGDRPQPWLFGALTAWATRLLGHGSQQPAAEAQARAHARSDDNLRECGVDLHSADTPFPVMSIDDFSSSAAAAMRAAYSAFAQLQADARAGRVLTQPCRTYDVFKGVVCDEQ